MNTKNWAIAIFMLLLCCGIVDAADSGSPLEKGMSDALDTWREGRFEQLYEQLAHRGKVSRETFVRNMRESSIKPACCWQKIENFKVLSEGRTEATVYAKIGLENAPLSAESFTREFKLSHQEGVWKMRLADVYSIAAVTGKKRTGGRGHLKNMSPYHN